jgi:hypothetical protein
LLILFSPGNDKNCVITALGEAYNFRGFLFIFMVFLLVSCVLFMHPFILRLLFAIDFQTFNLALKNLTPTPFGKLRTGSLRRREQPYENYFQTFQPSTFNFQPSTFNLQLSTFNLQPSTFNPLTIQSFNPVEAIL